MSESTRRGIGLLGGALILGVAGDGLLRAGPWGVNVVLWIAALALVFAFLITLVQPLRAVSRTGRLLLIPILAFAGAMAWRDSPVLNSLNILALLSCLALVALYARNGRMASAGVTDYVLGGMLVGLSQPVAPLLVVASDVKWPEVSRGGHFGAGPAVLRGVMLALPLVVMFGALFAAADAAFERLVTTIIHVDLTQLMGHSIFAVVVAWAVVAWGRQLLIAEPWGNPASGRLRPFTLGMIELSIVLGALDLLFLVFVIIQLGYLFGGGAFVEASDSFTYAEYYRRGFFELVTVAAVALPFLLVAHWLAAPTSARAARGLATLVVGFVGLLFVIMASAVLRGLLYTSLFGLTELRVYTMAFMVWLALVFVWFMATALRGHRERFAVGAFAAGLVVLGLLDTTNPDGLIAQTNLSRSGAPQPVDSRYLATLSADAVPILIGGLPALPVADQQQVLAALTVRWPAGPSDWRSWNWSRSQAATVLATAQVTPRTPANS